MNYLNSDFIQSNNIAESRPVSLQSGNLRFRTGPQSKFEADLFQEDESRS